MPEAGGRAGGREREGWGRTALGAREEPGAGCGVRGPGCGVEPAPGGRPAAAGDCSRLLSSALRARRLRLPGRP